MAGTFAAFWERWKSVGELASVGDLVHNFGESESSFSSVFRVLQV